MSVPADSAHHLPPTTDHRPPTTYHLPPTTYPVGELAPPMASVGRPLRLSELMGRWYVIAAIPLADEEVSGKW